MSHPEHIDVEALIQRLDLQPLPVEGGLFRQTWRGPGNAGTCIYGMLTDAPDSFSALHRLPTDEIWHFYLGDPLDLLLLFPNGTSAHVTLGSNLLGSAHCQYIVPAGTWMGARLLPGGFFALFGCTMAPGFDASGFEAGERAALALAFPHERVAIEALTRPGANDERMPDGI
ncbi:MAG: cupin domain-containing protein [Chloroflexi bacterium]|nr:cupin domain-containing protein [Chloroflexota bacterium]